MHPTVINIEELTRGNTCFREDVVTGAHSQVMLMSLLPGEDIGEETHSVDQTLVFLEGTGRAMLDGEESPIGAGTLVFVPAGTKHNFLNTGTVAMKLFTVYAPAEHIAGTTHPTKADAINDPNEHHDE